MQSLDTDPLSEARPRFLDLLDSDPEQAFRELHEFVHRVLGAFPPSVLAALPAADREEMPGRILLHLCDEGFRRLRSYRDRGVPFAHWLLCIARNMARDLLAKSHRERGRSVALPGQVKDEELSTGNGPHGGAASSPEEEAFFNRAVEKVIDVISRMDRKCRILLLGSAHELSPKDLARLLGWPEGWNAKVSDDRRYCRNKLRDLVRQEGLDLDGVV